MTAGNNLKSVEFDADQEVQDEPIVLTNIDELMLTPIEDKPSRSKPEKPDGFIHFGEPADNPAKTSLDREDAEKSFVSLNDFDEIEFDEEVNASGAMANANPQPLNAEAPPEPAEPSPPPPETSVPAHQFRIPAPTVDPPISQTRRKPIKQVKPAAIRIICWTLAALLATGGLFFGITDHLQIRWNTAEKPLSDIKPTPPAVDVKSVAPQSFASPATESTKITISDPLRLAFQTLNALILNIEERRRNMAQLSDFYRAGVEQETHELIRFIQEHKINRYEQAAQFNIELRLSGIASRRHYLAELKRLSDQLTLARERLAYIARKAEIDQLCLALFDDSDEPRIIEEVNREISLHQEMPRQLTLVDYEPNPVQLKNVFDTLVQAAQQEKSPVHANPEAEICRGRYELAVLLMRLTPETAKCLSRWNAKILYLGGVSRLSPESAEQLAKWPGDWLILNGVSEISPQTAKSLAAWDGRVLSLNGLSVLSETALNNLLTWKGQRLEISGVHSWDKAVSEYQALKMIKNMAEWEAQGRSLELSDAFRNNIDQLLTKRNSPT